ncbi:MAG: glycosyltransferase family 39 protein [Parcubacteria group bacterium]|nr:glycosyltransferase family 39 protein [Parcubacteria group bacterium]
MPWLALIRRLIDRHFLAVLGGLAALFFLVYASFYWGNLGLYPSPDEQANAVFARHLVADGNLQIPRAVDSVFVHPRSVTIVDQDFVPGFFLGLVLLLGFVGKLLGAWAMPLLPAVLAAAAPFAFYVISRRVFDETTSRLSAVFLFILPPFAYYAGRGFLPNATLVSVLLIGLACLFSGHGYWQQGRHKLAMALGCASGLGLGASFIIRPVEWVWVGLILLVLAIANRKAIRWPVMLPGLLCFLLLIGCLAYWQQQTYSAWYLTGYGQHNQELLLPDALGQTMPWPIALVVTGSQAIFPFGVDVWGALGQFTRQTLTMYWWLLPFFFFGLYAYRQSTGRTPEQKIYSGLFLLVSAYLILYYGSWVIADHPDPRWISLGVAYHRYWLPIFIMAIPYLVLGLRFVAARLARYWPPAGLLPWAAVVTISIALTYTFGPDSLGRLKANSVNYGHLRQAVLDATLPDGVIASERNDKLFWPDRQVIHFGDNDYPGLAVAVERITAPLYVLSALPPSHAAVVEQRDFAPRNLHFIRVAAIDGFTLYRLAPLDFTPQS